MELRHLRYFVAAAEERHFGRAARRLHVTRPAVSRIISDLEDEFGVVLLERHSRGVQLTAAGRAFLERIRPVLGDITQAVEVVKQTGRGEVGHLRVGYGSQSLFSEILRGAIKEFRSDTPGVALELSEMTSPGQLDALLTGKLQVGFIHAPERYDERIETFTLEVEKLAIALPAGHALASRRTIRPADLNAERFISLPRGVIGYKYIELMSSCLNLGLEPKVVQEVANTSGLVTLVSAGMGVAFVNIGRGLRYPQDIVIRPVQGISWTNRFDLVWMKGPREPVVDQFVKTVRRVRDKSLAD